MRLNRKGVQKLEKLNEAFRDVGNALGELAKAVGNAIKAIAESLYARFDTEFCLAYLWAKEAHPEWVTILNRTKKKRIRKKYQDRILREYRKRMGR